MTKAIVLPASILAPFLAFSLYCIATTGYFGFVPVVTGSPWGIQVGLDLFLSLGLVVMWTVRDARERGLPAWPFVLLTWSAGSIGPLIYLVVRGVKGASAGTKQT